MQAGVLAVTEETVLHDLDMRLRLLSSQHYLGPPSDFPEHMGEPWWGLIWPGGHILASHILRHPQRFRGRRVVDVGSGCGIASIAAAMIGAKQVVANDVCEYAAVAVALNSQLNGVTIHTHTGSIIGSRPADYFSRGDALIVGDLFYDSDVATPLLPWLQSCVAHGVEVTVGDPGRPGLHKALQALPKERRARVLSEMETVDLPASVSWDHYGCVQGTIYRVLPSRPGDAPV
jgi:predicted nicotinamide N-methyase